MKYFVVADVHGFYTQMMEALDKAGFEKDNPDHTFVSLGDLLDRGDMPGNCIKFVNGLERKILVKGNHEELLMKMLCSRTCHDYDISNGTCKTVVDLYQQFSGNDYSRLSSCCYYLLENDELKKYFDSLVDFAEFGDYIGVHGWIPYVYENNELASADNFRYAHHEDWEEARWMNGMQEWADGYVPEGKTVLCGHWHTSFGHAVLHKQGSEFGENAIFDPFEDKGIIALDACTAWSHKVNCKVIEIPD